MKIVIGLATLGIVGLAAAAKVFAICPFCF